MTASFWGEVKLEARQQLNKPHPRETEQLYDSLLLGRAERFCNFIALVFLAEGPGEALLCNSVCKQHLNHWASALPEHRILVQANPSAPQPIPVRASPCSNPTNNNVSSTKNSNNFLIIA